MGRLFSNRWTLRDLNNGVRSTTSFGSGGVIFDLLVNNAGIGGSGEVGRFSLESWRQLLEVNLFGGVMGCHTMVEWLKANPRGAHLMNTASFAAMAAAPSMAAYNVAKAGMLALSETLYGELLAWRRRDGGLPAVLSNQFAGQLAVYYGGRTAARSSIPNMPASRSTMLRKRRFVRCTAVAFT